MAKPFFVEPMRMRKTFNSSCRSIRFFRARPSGLRVPPNRWRLNRHSRACRFDEGWARPRHRRYRHPGQPATLPGLGSGLLGCLGSGLPQCPIPIASMRCPAPLLALAAALGACLCAAPAAIAAPDPSGQAGTKAIFATKAEAEAAAKQFHCQGAHKMGDLWMPCASHGAATGAHSGHVAH